MEFNDLIMDIKLCKFFDGVPYAIVGIKSQIIIFEIDTQNKDFLVQRKKITNQIAIYSMKIKTLDYTTKSNKRVQTIQILVGDMMKSLSVHEISFNPITFESGNPNLSQDVSIRKFNLKHRFPFGQWCTASEMVDSSGMDSDSSYY